MSLPFVRVLAASVPILLAGSASAAAQAPVPEPAWALQLDAIAGMTAVPATSPEPTAYGARVSSTGLRLSVASPGGWTVGVTRTATMFETEEFMMWNANGEFPGRIGYTGHVTSLGVDRRIATWNRFVASVGFNAGTFDHDHWQNEGEPPRFVGDLHVTGEWWGSRWIAPRLQIQTHTHSPLLLMLGVQLRVPAPRSSADSASQPSPAGDS